MKKTKPRVRSGRNVKTIRWTLELAASEFGLNPRTLAQRIKRAGVLPGEDKRFSTSDIAASIYDDYERQRTRKTKEEADDIALKNAASRGDLVDKQDFLKRLEPVCVAMKQRVMQCSMSDAEKDGLLADLAKLMQA